MMRLLLVAALVVGCGGPSAAPQPDVADELAAIRSELRELRAIVEASPTAPSGGGGYLSLSSLAPVDRSLDNLEAQMETIEDRLDTICASLADLRNDLAGFEVASGCALP